MLRWQISLVITSKHKNIGLIHCSPMRNPVAKLSETQIRICREVFPAFTHDPISHSLPGSVLGARNLYSIETVGRSDHKMLSTTD